MSPYPRRTTLLQRLIALPMRVAAARREMTLLARLDDRGLSDIGLTRLDLGSGALDARGREREALASRAHRRAS